MGRFRWLTVGIVVAGLLATGVAFAQGPRAGGRGTRGPLGPDGLFPALGRLGLSEAQQAQVREIRDRHREEMQGAVTTLAAARQKQRAAVEKVPADEAQIASVTQDMTQAEIDVAVQASRLNTEIWSVLTSAQREQLTKMRADRQARLQARPRASGGR